MNTFTLQWTGMLTKDSPQNKFYACSSMFYFRRKSILWANVQNCCFGLVTVSVCFVLSLSSCQLCLGWFKPHCCSSMGEREQKSCSTWADWDPAAMPWVHTTPCQCVCACVCMRTVAEAECDVDRVAQKHNQSKISLTGVIHKVGSYGKHPRSPT